MARVEEAVSYYVEHGLKMSVEKILGLHAMLFQDVPEDPSHPKKPGEFRGFTELMRAEGVQHLTEQMPSALEVPHRLRDLLYLIEHEEMIETNGVQHPKPAFYKAAQMHYRFVRIHPFCDGNGRMARALSLWLLAEHNELVLESPKPVNEILHEHKEAYISILEYCDGLYAYCRDQRLSEEEAIHVAEQPFILFYCDVYFRCAVHSAKELYAQLMKLSEESGHSMDQLGVEGPPPEETLLPELTLDAVRKEIMKKGESQ